MLQKVSYCSLLKRWIITLYDGLIIVAISFGVTVLWLPFNSTEAITAASVLWWPYRLSLLMAAWLYLAISWRMVGQTMGMRAWQVKIVSQDQKSVSWRQTIIRYLVAGIGLLMLGLGFWWALLRNDRATLHDLASGTRLVRV